MEDDTYQTERQTEADILDELPLLIQMENVALQCALEQISERERYVFMARVLDGISFEELGVELGLGYKGVAAVYYRAVSKIRKRMKDAKDENLGIADLLVEKYQGIRPAVGYPSLPDQSVNFLLDEQLDMKQIGISLTENGAMYPHASVCGLMFSHPASEYFSVGKIGEDQLEDYARRRGKSIEEICKFLAANLQ